MTLWPGDWELEIMLLLCLLFRIWFYCHVSYLPDFGLHFFFGHIVISLLLMNKNNFDYFSPSLFFLFQLIELCPGPHSLDWWKPSDYFLEQHVPVLIMRMYFISSLKGCVKTRKAREIRVKMRKQEKTDEMWGMAEDIATVLLLVWSKTTNRTNFNQIKSSYSKLMIVHISQYKVDD